MIKLVLAANTVTCVIFGVLLLNLPGAVATYVGSPPIWLVTVLGAILLSNAVLLVITARQEEPNRALVWFFVLGDGGWVLGTLVLVLAGIWITTSAGVWSSLAIAILVGAFGLLQWRWLRAHTKT